MKRRINRRTTPTVTTLEGRLLLTGTGVNGEAAVAASSFQGNDDFVGATNAQGPNAKNDYSDVHISLSNITKTIVAAEVRRDGIGGGAWQYGWTADFAAYVTQNLSAHTAEVYFDAYFDESSIGDKYSAVLKYSDGTYSDGTTTGNSAPSFIGTNTIDVVVKNVDKNKRVSGMQLSATFNGQLDNQDWTGPYIGVGPDGYKDFKLALSNLSKGVYQRAGDKNPTFVVTAAKTGQSPISWRAGGYSLETTAGQMTAELMGWADLTSSATANLYASPTNDLSQGWSIRVDVTYHDDARAGKTDTYTIASGSVTAATSATAAMSYGSVSDPTSITAHWISQDPTDSGNVHIALDSANPSGTTVVGAILTNSVGTAWTYGSAPPSQDALMPLKWDATGKVFSFPPVRDEAGSTLTLRVFYSNGTTISSAVARLAGGFSNPDLRDKPRGTTTTSVSTVAGLLSALSTAQPADTTHQYAQIQLADGTYTLTQPLVLGYAVEITGSQNAILRFAPSGQTWVNQDAVNIMASHTTLSGFTIDLTQVPGTWTHNNGTEQSVVYISNRVRDTTLTGLTIQSEATLSGAANKAIVAISAGNSGYPDVGGRITNNTIHSGSISLDGGPWTITNNDIQGPYSGEWTDAAFRLARTHNVLIQGNHIHLADSASSLNRFIVWGGHDSNNGFNDVIDSNTFDGGAG